MVEVGLSYCISGCSMEMCVGGDRVLCVQMQ